MSIINDIKMHQLTLPIRLQDDATFASFYAGANQILINYLQAFLQARQDNYLYLWGYEGVGCSHLLQACCQAVRDQGQTAVYIPLAYIADFSPSILDELETIALICLDDIQMIAGKSAWEEAVFHLYNRTQNVNHKL